MMKDRVTVKNGIIAWVGWWGRGGGRGGGGRGGGVRQRLKVVEWYSYHNILDSSATVLVPSFPGPCIAVRLLCRHY